MVRRSAIGGNSPIPPGPLKRSTSRKSLTPTKKISTVDESSITPSRVARKYPSNRAEFGMINMEFFYLKTVCLPSR